VDSERPAPGQKDPEALLPQPGGFEGLLGVKVRPHQNRVAGLEFGHAAHWRLGFGPAFLSAYSEMADSDDPIATSRIFENSTWISPRVSSVLRISSRTPSCPRYTVASPPSDTSRAGYHSTSVWSYPIRRHWRGRAA
jgi:hypothetical protein